MNKAQLVIASAMIAAFSLSLPAAAHAGPAPSPTFEHQKCFGIAKAGKNEDGQCVVRGHLAA